MNDRHNALPAGYRLSEYEIQTVLGSGGFGITYKARDRNLGKLVAIKEYLPSDFAVRVGRANVKPKSGANKDDYAWGLERFIDEARTLARFDHPHINKVHRYFQDNGTAYLVLEYVEGDMLSDLLKSKGRFNEAGVRRMLDELLDGLDKVHSAGYIHRDIKPANIIFRRDGGAVLLDFGAARQAIGQRSQVITSILTPGYAPVEQYLNAVDAMGAWSDLYSLGVVAYRCLVGGDESVIIDAPSRAHLAKRGEMDKDMPLAVMVGKGKYSASLLSAIDWAMRVEESARPQSVAEMQAVLAGEDKAVAPSSTPAPTPKRAPTPTRTAQTNATKQAKRVNWGKYGWIAVAMAVVVIVYDQDRNENFSAEEVPDWRRVDCDNANAVRAHLQKYPNGRYRAEAHKCWRELVAAEAEQHRKFGVAAVEQAAFDQRYRRDASASHVDRSGNTDLHLAAENRWLKLAQWLIDNGADMHVKNDIGDTPLHIAVSENDAEVVKLLLANGADVHVNSHFGGKTPLHLAVSENAAEAAKVLIANGAGVNVKNEFGRTPLHLAVSENAVNVFKVLLANGADVHVTNKSGEAPLHIAVAENAVDAAKMLLANGADVHAKSNFGGKTPLHIAASENAVDLAKILIANGAKVNVADDFGMTALEYAIREDNRGMQSLLRQHGGRCRKRCN